MGGQRQRLGLDVEDTRFDSPAGMLVPLAANQLDVVSGALAAGLYNAFARDIDVRVVADRVTLAPGYGYQALVVRQDLWESGAVRTLADLPGFQVGIYGHQADSQLPPT